VSDLAILASRFFYISIGSYQTAFHPYERLFHFNQRLSCENETAFEKYVFKIYDNRSKKNHIGRLVYVTETTKRQH
jgi:hypothetical protein